MDPLFKDWMDTLSRLANRDTSPAEFRVCCAKAAYATQQQVVGDTIRRWSLLPDATQARWLALTDFVLPYRHQTESEMVLLIEEVQSMFRGGFYGSALPTVVRLLVHGAWNAIQFTAGRCG